MNDSNAQLNNHARTVVHHIADDLADIKPWQTVTRSIRNHTLTKAGDLYGYTTYADAVSNIARAIMPTPRPDETRGEYAIRCRTAAGRLTTR